MSEPLLDGGDIERLLGELTTELSSDRQRQVILAGGALLALRGLRSATRDVDSVRRLDAELRQAIARVAVRNDLAPTWLNDAAEPFLPATFDLGECTTVIDHPSLLVLAVSLDQVFLMKVFASRATDAPDLEAMWPHCSFDSVEAAATAFFEAYPHEELDPFLADHLRGIVGS